MGRKAKKVNSKKRRARAKAAQAADDGAQPQPAIVTVPTTSDDDEVELDTDRLEDGSSRYFFIDDEEEENSDDDDDEDESNDEDDDEEDEDRRQRRRGQETEKGKMGGKEMKKETKRARLVALKKLVSSPGVVDEHDGNGRDPLYLYHLKTYPCSVAVPGHWLSKRGYLRRPAGHPLYTLPDYIAATGVIEMREALRAKEDEKSLRRQARERVRPKLGQLELNYEALHRAFYVDQKKPTLTGFGEVYYEGKDAAHKKCQLHHASCEFVPGQLSEALREALGMLSPTSPPPYLFAMQRHGLPPSYPTMEVPGVNAPLPPGASYGFHAGEWGRPPTDPAGNALFPRAMLPPDASNAPAYAAIVVPQVPVFGRITDDDDESDDDESDDDESDNDESVSDDDTKTTVDHTSVSDLVHPTPPITQPTQPTQPTITQPTQPTITQPTITQPTITQPPQPTQMIRPVVQAAVREKRDAPPVREEPAVKKKAREFKF